MTTIPTPGAAAAPAPGARPSAVPPSAAGPRPALVITVYGKPATQGSKRARPIFKGRGEDKVFTGKVAQVEENKEKHKAWRIAVKEAALAVVDGLPRIEDAPVHINVVFCFDKPKSAPKRRRTWPITRSSGDVDKLQRATFDALTDAGVFKDDSQIVQVRADKVFTDDPAAPLTVPGAFICVLEVTA